MLQSSLSWSRRCCCTPPALRPRRLAHRRRFSLDSHDVFIAPRSSRLPTIFAPATGKGKSAIAILRISGDDALEVWRRMTVAPKARKRSTAQTTEPPERKAVLRKIVHPETEEVLDEGVVVYFPRESPRVRLPSSEEGRRRLICRMSTRVPLRCSTVCQGTRP